MSELGLTSEAMTALMLSFTAGISALVVLIIRDYPHDCGNRYCPHRRQRPDEEEDRRFWRR